MNRDRVLALLAMVHRTVVVTGFVRVQDTMDVMEVVALVMMAIHGLHLDDKVATRCVDILGVEDTAVSLKSA